jgi:hypothetical protein
LADAGAAAKRDELPKLLVFTAAEAGEDVEVEAAPNKLVCPPIPPNIPPAPAPIPIPIPILLGEDGVEPNLLDPNALVPPVEPNVVALRFVGLPNVGNPPEPEEETGAGAAAAAAKAGLGEVDPPLFPKSELPPPPLLKGAGVEGEVDPPLFPNSELPPPPLKLKAAGAGAAALAGAGEVVPPLFPNSELPPPPLKLKAAGAGAGAGALDL